MGAVQLTASQLTPPRSSLKKPSAILSKLTIREGLNQISNIKYQILKMSAIDEADEGQILWELGFDGYPFKIMQGENNTRKPIFKVESMSDYTATSRNAFIALKKEATHDLAWRLSYLEKTSS